MQFQGAFFADLRAFCQSSHSRYCRAWLMGAKFVASPTFSILPTSMHFRGKRPTRPSASSLINLADEASVEGLVKSNRLRTEVAAHACSRTPHPVLAEVMTVILYKKMRATPKRSLNAFLSLYPRSVIPHDSNTNIFALWPYPCRQHFPSYIASRVIQNRLP